MRKAKIEQDYKISQPFKILLGFVAVCVLLTFFVLIWNGAKRSLFTLSLWEPTATTKARVIDSVFENHIKSPDNYKISYTYTVDGKVYTDSDSVNPKDFKQQEELDVVYKQADPSVNKLALSINNPLYLLGVSLTSTGALVLFGLAVAYYLVNFRPKNLKSLRRTCLTIVSVGLLIVIVSRLL
ncbi:MAG: hypothetical protein U0524_01405 [Candidatus Saccharimonadales bacterium]